jgi:hypothetical protein
LERTIALESLTKPINLKGISYPVFKIGEEIPSFDNGVCFYLRQYKLEDNQVRNVLLVIDDKNIDKSTLSLRRLSLMSDKVTLKKLSNAVFFLGDLVKLADRKSWFIDSNGEVFQYKKTKSVPLEFRRITKVIAISSGSAIIEVEGIASRFKVLYAPREDEVYAGVLKDGITYILYGVYTQKFDKTRRMI